MPLIVTEDGLVQAPFIPLSPDGRKDVINRATSRRENSRRDEAVPKPNNSALCAGCFRALVKDQTTYCTVCDRIEADRADREELKAMWRDRYVLLFALLLGGWLIFLTLKFAPNAAKPAIKRNESAAMTAQFISKAGN